MDTDTELRDWGFRRADGILPGLVASAVGYAATGIEQRIHRGLPSPYLTFIITLDEPVISGSSVQQALGADAACADIITAGLHGEPAYIRQPAAQTGIQLAVDPRAARTIFGLPAGELAGATVDGRDVLGREVADLREQLITAEDWSVRFGLLERYLLDRIDRADRHAAIRPELAAALTWLACRHGTGSVAGLADHVHLSPRQLHTLFVAEFGVGPKLINRMMRFQRALRMITGRVEHGQRTELAGVAADCGYADQAHLTRDFTAFTGTSPTGWLSEELATIRSGGHQGGDSGSA